MKKILITVLMLVSLNALAYKYKNGDLFKNRSIIGLTAVSAVLEPYNELSLDWKIAATATGTFTVFGSNDSVTDTSDIVRWYSISKDVAGATITATAATGATESGYIDLGRFNYRWLKLTFTPDSGGSTTTSNAVINSSYMTKGW